MMAVRVHRTGPSLKPRIRVQDGFWLAVSTERMDDRYMRRIRGWGETQAHAYEDWLHWYRAVCADKSLGPCPFYEDIETGKPL